MRAPRRAEDASRARGRGVALGFTEDLLEDVPHRQVVFTIPKRLRIYFRYDRKLLGELAGCAWRAIRLYLLAAFDSEDIQAGAVGFIQTAGELLRYRHHCFPEPLDLRIQRAAGSIKIEAPEGLYRLGITDRSILVLFRGKTFLTLRDLVWWASLHGEVPRKEALVVPMIEPGEYYACEMTLGEIFPALQGRLPASCQAHYLPQGGEIVIRVGGDI